METEKCEHRRLQQLNKLVQLDQEADSDLKVSEFDDQFTRMLVDLGQQAEGERCHGIVAPGLVKCDEQRAAFSSRQFFELLSQVVQLRRGEKNEVQVLNHAVSKLKVVFF